MVRFRSKVMAALARNAGSLKNRSHILLYSLFVDIQGHYRFAVTQDQNDDKTTPRTPKRP